MGQNQTVTTANWSSQPAVFHHNHGNNIRLSENNTVAERTAPFFGGVVMTAEPVPIGKMFQVTVLEKENKWSGGLVSVCTENFTTYNCAVPSKQVYQLLVEKSWWRTTWPTSTGHNSYFWLPVMSIMQNTLFIFRNSMLLLKAL